MVVLPAFPTNAKNILSQFAIPFLRAKSGNAQAHYNMIDAKIWQIT
jgi:hypothetical protein